MEGEAQFSRSHHRFRCLSRCIVGFVVWFLLRYLVAGILLRQDFRLRVVRFDGQAGIGEEEVAESRMSHRMWPGDFDQLRKNSRRRTAGLSIAVNVLLSWTVLPLVIPPFRLYSLRELIEVLLWQAMGAVGWLLGSVGVLANLLLHHQTWTDLVGLLFLAMYPVMILCLLLTLFSKRTKWWPLALLHILLTVSFAVIWYKVLNGYDFMKG